MGRNPSSVWIFYLFSQMFLPRAMIRLTALALIILSSTADPRSPRVYNVLISSKKNLSPSHAQPLYEPVLRTTSIGYAFPSVFYHSSFIQSVPTPYISPDYPGYKKVESSIVNTNGAAAPNRIPQVVVATQQNLPVNTRVTTNTASQIRPEESQENPKATIGQVIPQHNPYELNYYQYSPKEEGSGPINPLSGSTQEDDPKKVIANLKKNPDIPDVPPPPLPFRISTKL